ncbi:MAG: DUF3187 family protein [Pseudomonadales bacterium]
MSKYRPFLYSWLVSLITVPGFAEQGERPLAIRNLSPVAGLYGLPRMRGGALGEGLQLSVNIAQVSNFTSANIGGTQVFFDGETTVFDYSLSRRWGEQAEWGVTFPYVAHSGGFLDGFIDDFHSLFGLPEGGRERAKSDQLDYLVRIDGETLVSFDDSRGGIGDVQAWLGYALWDAPAREVNLRAQVKLPTGRSSRLTGSEGLDIALWAELQERRLLQSLGAVISLGAGAVWLDEGELAPRSQESWAMVGHFGLRRGFGSRFELLGQLDAHSQLHDNPADAMGGSALMGSLGLRAAITPRLQMEFVVIEDLQSRSTSDVVFQLQLDAWL